MVDQKQRIIKREGSPMSIHPVMGADFETVAIMGKATTQLNTSLSLEYTRKAQFLPDVHIDNGCILTNLVSNEKLLCMGVFPEIIRGVHTVNIADFYMCNATIDVSGEVKSADIHGNISKTFVIKNSGVSCHAQAVNDNIRKFDPGIFPETKYVIIAPQNDVSRLDTITLYYETFIETLKVVAVDNMFYYGVSKIQLVAETRKL